MWQDFAHRGVVCVLQGWYEHILSDSDKGIEKNLAIKKEASFVAALCKSSSVFHDCGKYFQNHQLFLCFFQYDLILMSSVISHYVPCSWEVSKCS